MNIQEINEKIELFINNKSLVPKFEDMLDDNSYESFCLHTLHRLVNSYLLYVDDIKYKNDFILALRDYMLVFDTSLQIENQEILKNNEFGIVYDDIEQKFFATYQLPGEVNEKFVKEAFLKDLRIKVFEDKCNLTSDPMIYNLTGYCRFKTLAQKLAVYGALNTPDGFTTLISLPTGGGKSLITQTIAYQKEGLTVVIVPTVSLAIDQERVAKQIINRSDINNEVFSYSSGVSITPIMKAINDKKARLLFISPEALLENPLFADIIKNANKARYLKNIVIDEAHIVVDWGASFRVDYQCLEAWRNMLLMTNPTLRTILLSATFEDRCVEILKNFFSLDDRWIEVRCDALRHEPRYCVIRKKNYYDKEKCIIELVRKLPHPMIVYVARPSDAENLKNVMQKNGIYNVRTFTGLTSATKRKELIDEWVEDKFQIMIATSAFGVGVDKGDVRTVIHTYIPQNSNTYYQELGRGGRDRLPCLSIMCLDPEDTTRGRDRISKKVLTTEKIVGRWDSMFNNSRSVRLSNNKVFIDTSIKPNYSDVDEFDDTPTSDFDMNWNIYVLLFLRRYNMIKIIEVTIENGVYRILIEVVNDFLRNIDDDLKNYIATIREKEWGYYSSSYNAISNAVSRTATGCISELFAETYSKVYEFCAGCNSHQEPIVGDSFKFPLKNKISKPVNLLTDEQRIPFGDSKELVTIVSKENMSNLVSRLVRKGIKVLIVPDNYKNSEDLLGLDKSYSFMIIGLNEAYKLLSKKAFYYISGLIAIIYPQDENEISKQYVLVRNNICSIASVNIIHIIEKNIYIKEAGKMFVELVDGPSIQPSVIYP